MSRAMGEYSKIPQKSAISMTTRPSYQQDSGEFYMYMTGKKWRIGTTLGSENSNLSCGAHDWWPCDIHKVATQKYFWQL